MENCVNGPFSGQIQGKRGANYLESATRLPPGPQFPPLCEENSSQHRLRPPAGNRFQVFCGHSVCNLWWRM